MTVEYYLILIRAVHFGACLLLFCLPAFDCLLAGPVFTEKEIAARWRSGVRSWQRLLLPAALLSGIAWFVLVAMNMSGGSPDMATLKLVWTQTQFGTVCQWRLGFWTFLAMTLAVPAIYPWHAGIQMFCQWPQWVVSGILLGSLAWAGHGQETSSWHLAADVLHLLAAGFWPAGLLPLFLLLRTLQQAPDDRQLCLAYPLVRRFSVSSLTAVALLSATGLANSWFLVGSFSNLLSQNYGRWLLAKVVFFLFAVALGAMNLLWWKPGLATAETFSSASAKIRRNVFFELILGGIVIIIVAVLGILPPAIQ